MPETLSSERLTELRRESHQRLIEPLKEEVAEINAAISDIESEIEARIAELRASKDAELDELRTARRESLALIRVIEPDFGKRKIRRRLGPDPAKNAEARKAVILDWLRAHAGDEQIRVYGFTAKGIYDRGRNGDKSVPRMGRDKIGEALKGLADDGVIRLDRRGSGGAMIFKLVGRHDGP